MPMSCRRPDLARYLAIAGRMCRTLFSGWTALLVLQGVGPTYGGESSPETKAKDAFFEKEVRPLLVEHCLSCHGEKKQSGGLRLDFRDAVLTGGGTGPAVVPEHPEKSLLMEAVRYESLEMPPQGKLPEAKIQTLERWIKMGLPWPESDQAAGSRHIPGKITDEDRQWWAFQPIRNGEPPSLNGDPWIKTPVDAFILDRLRTTNLTPAPAASRVTLIRRLYFDLWGLAPTPQEVDEFVQDTNPLAYEQLVDRLLASPRYGERWARHWLDLVRYADSDGYRIDDYRPQIWRYRDYVINALNTDKPYDRFLQEQLAGDELFPDSEEAQIATAYLRLGIYEYNARDVRAQWAIMLNDITDTTADAFLGLGLQCARCHDHKFDPLLQKDYYRLQAFFASILPRDDRVIATEAQRQAFAEKAASWETATADIRREIAELEVPYRQSTATEAITKFPDEIQEMIRKPVGERSPLEHQLAELAYRQVTYEHDRIERKFQGESKEKLFALRKQLAAFDKLRPEPLPVPMTTTDVGPVAPPVTIPQKGSPPVEPGFVTILDPQPAQIVALPQAPASTGRRAALARWLTAPENPLTSRVMANRIWQYHFGRGLAENASDFGRLGQPPSHPELLDWLAATFIKQGWSIKQLHRAILLSSTYQQSSQHPAPMEGLLKDPEDRLLWHAPVRRLDAEQIRDSLYQLTGELDLTSGGPGALSDVPRRTIYTRIMRNTRDPIADVFDAPFWFTSASSRDTTTTPIQSLFLINSQQLLQRAQALAQRVRSEHPGDLSAQITHVYRLTLGREPKSEELSSALAFIDDQKRRIEPTEAGSEEARFLYGKIPYRDGQAALCDPAGQQRSFQVDLEQHVPGHDFTIEAHIFLKSIFESGEVRTVASTWNSNRQEAGWAFGVTGKGSRRKPQTLVVQLFGRKPSGEFGEDTVFSDQHLQLNKPYYVAAAVKLATATERGTVTFYLKDLSNDDEPLLIANVEHGVSGGLVRQKPMGIGSQSDGTGGGFDGLIDDVRLSNTALAVDQLLFTSEGAGVKTVGFWQFEPKFGVFQDSSGHGLSLRSTGSRRRQVNLDEAALQDFSHVLLNSSEFLYVE